MTHPIRNVLLALTVLLFGGFAIHDASQQQPRSALEDGFIGSMVCFVILRTSRAPKREASPPA